jgi:anti-anti-sigma factor
MNFKINTKEKFQEIHIIEAEVTANMTGDFVQMLIDISQKDPKNIILTIKEVKKMDISFGEALTGIQTRYYDDGSSFVICEMDPHVEETLEHAGILETMNVVPTLSEARDIVQMEEIERELLDNW